MKIPTLHSGTRQVLESVEDKVAYIIRHSLVNPGFTSDMIEDDLLSFRKLEATYDNRIGEIVRHYKHKLELTLNRVLGFTVDVSIKTLKLNQSEKENKLYHTSNEDAVNGDKYSLEISVLYKDSGMPIITYGKIIIGNGNIKINFDGE